MNNLSQSVELDNLVATCQQAGNKQCEHILLISCWSSIVTSLLQVCYNLYVLKYAHHYISTCTGCTRGHKTLGDVECYDPDQNTWSEVAPLLVPRTGACAVTLDDTIIVIGGTNSKKPLSSCEIYDRNKNKWEYIARECQVPYFILLEL